MEASVWAEEFEIVITSEQKVESLRRQGNARKERGEDASALRAYNEASYIARAELASDHPARLRVALDLARFFHEMNSPDEACFLAKDTLDRAVVRMERHDKESCEASGLLVQELRDALKQWAGDELEWWTDTVDLFDLPAEGAKAYQ